MFRVKNEDIRTTTTSGVSLVDFEPVNASWDVIRSLLNYFWIYFKIVHAHLTSTGKIP